MAVKFLNDAQAKEYLLKYFSKEDLNREVDSLCSKIPKSVIENFGDTRMQQAANYHQKWAKKEELISVEELLVGGGLFKSSSALFDLPPKTYFTVIPEGEEHLRLIIPKQETSRVVFKSDFASELIKGKIVEKFKTQGRNLIVERKKLTAEDIKIEKDFNKAVTELRKLFKKYKIESAEDFMAELDAMSLAVPEEYFKAYPDNAHGRIIALASYVEENKDDVIDVLRNSYESPQLVNKIEDTAITTGAVFYTTKETDYFSDDRVLVLYHDKASDTFTLVVVSGDLRRYAIGEKIAVGLITSAEVLVLASIAIPTPIVLPLAAAALIAGETTKVVNNRLSNAVRFSLKDTYVVFTREEIQKLLDEGVFISNRKLWDSVKYLNL